MSSRIERFAQNARTFVIDIGLGPGVSPSAIHLLNILDLVLSATALDHVPTVAWPSLTSTNPTMSAPSGRLGHGGLEAPKFRCQEDLRSANVLINDAAEFGALSI
jgi:hypothetical protein